MGSCVWHCPSSSPSPRRAAMPTLPAYARDSPPASFRSDSEHGGSIVGQLHSVSYKAGTRGSESVAEKQSQINVPSTSGCLCTQRVIVWASYEELESLQASLATDAAILFKDTVLGGELVKRGAQLRRVGTKNWIYNRRTPPPVSVSAAQVAIRKYIEEEEPARLVFLVQRASFPWCCVIYFPCLLLTIVIASVVAIVVGGYIQAGAPTIDTNFDSFMSSDGIASLNYDAILFAIEGRKGKSDGRRLKVKMYKTYSLEVTFARPDGSMLARNAIKRSHDVEKEMQQLPAWKALCEKNDPRRMSECSPGISFSNVAYPVTSERSEDSYTLVFNGSGTKMLPLEFAVDFARAQDLLSLFFPMQLAKERDIDIEGLPCEDIGSECGQSAADGHCKAFAEYEVYMRDFCPQTCGLCSPTKGLDNVSIPPKVVQAIRSYYLFRTFGWEANQGNEGARLAEMNDEWNGFIADLIELVSAKSNKDLRIYYKGDKIETFEAMRAVQSDLQYAGFSYLFVLFYATLHTRSILLAVVGLFLVMLSIPAALGIFQMASGSTSVSLMSCLSIFIVVGIGSDMLFVYTDFWKQSIGETRDLAGRLRYTYKQAATSTAATTFTTAMSFFANLASVLRPMREFGFFMGSCVVATWFIMFLGYPPLLIVGERCHRRLRTCILGQKNTHDPDANATTRLSFLAMGKIASRSSVAFAAMLDPEKKGVGEVHKNCLAKFASVLHRLRYIVLIGFIGLTAMFVLMAVRQLEQDPDIPQIFQPDHNQVAGKAYDSLFRNFEGGVSTISGTGCTNLFQKGCSIYQCRTSGRAVGSTTSCKCSPYAHVAGLSVGGSSSPTSTLASGTTLAPICGAKFQLEFRIVGHVGMPPTSITEASILDLVRIQYPEGSAGSATSWSVSSSKMLVENWETGRTDIAHMFDVPSITVHQADGSKPGCVPPPLEVCYCGIERCESSGSSIGYGNLELGEDPFRRLAAPLVDNGDMARRLQQASNVRPENQIDVLVAFGITVTGTNPLLGEAVETPYEFNPSFKLEDPWAQRQLIRTCELMGWDNTTTYDLKIASLSCWVLGFRHYWMNSRGEDWPVRPQKDFHGEVFRYASRFKTNGTATTKFIWFNASNHVQATYTRSILSESKNIPSGFALEIMAKWDKFIDYFNQESVVAVQGAVHASRLWVRAEAEKVILDSTVITLGISLGCVLLGVVVFTLSVHLAIMVMFVVMAIILCLLFFMVVVMEWKIGAIEVLSLIVFVGFAVDYCLHVAHKYHSCHIESVQTDEEQEEAVRRGSGVSSDTQDSGLRSEGLWIVHSPTLRRDSGRVSILSDERPTVRIRMSDTASKIDLGVRSKTDSAVTSRREERFARASYALERMGGAVVGSALTTVGSAVFLLLCQLVIFTKIGAVVAGVTCFAILYALLPLPALLMIAGPCRDDLAACRRALRRRAHRAAEPEQARSVSQDGENSASTAPCPGTGVAESRPVPEQETSMVRRYVLHLPSKPMSQLGADANAGRTRVTAAG